MRMEPVAVACWILAALSMALDGWLSDRSLQLSEAATAFGQALADSRQELAKRLGSITSDPTLTYNLTWNLTHSVKRTLEGQIEPGRLDQLALWRRGGDVLGRAPDRDLPPSFSSTVLRTPQGTDPQSDSWDTDGPEPAPAMVMIRPVALKSSSGVWVWGRLALGEAWLSHHARLRGEMSRLGLQLQPGGQSAEPATIVHQEAHGSVALVTSRRLDRLLLAQGTSLRHGARLGAWLSLALGCLASLSGMLRLRRQVAARDQVAHDHSTWCQNLKIGPTGRRLTTEPKVRSPFVQAQGAILQLLATQDAQLQEKISLLEQAQAELKAKGREIEHQQGELQKTVRDQALAREASLWTESFVEESTQILHLSQKVRETLQIQLGPLGQELGQLTAIWQRGIIERGARKFIRSLAESPGSRAPLTILDDHLAHWAQRTGDLDRLAHLLAGEIDDLGHRLGRLQQMTRHWSQMSGIKKNPRSAASLQSALKEAQDLCLWQAKRQNRRLHFNDLGHEGEDRPLPDSPHHIWVSALYHLFKGLGGSTLNVRCRTARERRILVIHAPRHAASQDGISQEAAKSAVRLAQGLLAPYSVTVCYLPSRDGDLQIAVEWPLTAPTSTGRDRHSTKENSLKGTPSKLGSEQLSDSQIS